MRRTEIELSALYVTNLQALGATEQHIQALTAPEYLETGPKSCIEYSVLEGTSDAALANREKIFYVPGFSENPISNAPFATALTKYGYDVILPGHYDGPVLKNESGKRDALYTRAHHYAALLYEIGSDATPVHFVTHSMGNLVLQKMMAENNGMFQDARVAMLAPSGISNKDSVFKMALRNARNMKIEKSRGRQEFNDDAGDMEKSCTKYMTSRFRHAGREVLELPKKRGFDPEPFRRAGVARVALAGYANDALYPDTHIDEAVQRLADAGVDVVYVTPIKIGLDHSTATHNDEQSNPARVAPFVANFLREN